MRTGTGARRGIKLGSPASSNESNFSIPSFRPSNGQASAERNWRNLVLAGVDILQAEVTLTIRM